MRLLATFLTALVVAGAATGQDPEIANHRSGISLTWDGSNGVDYAEEYFYHDKVLWDFKVVYIKDSTPIKMALNETAAVKSGGKIRFSVRSI